MKTGRIPTVTGSFAATGQSAAFYPDAERPFNVTITGTFVATIVLKRSFDAGSTWVPLTVTAGGTIALYSFTGAVSEVVQEFEPGVQYRLECTAYTSGTATYRISC